MKKIMTFLCLAFPVLLWGQDYKAKKDDDSGKWGYVDASSKWVIKPQFYHASDFENGFGRIYGDDMKTTGVIDANGKFVVPCKYESVLIYNLEYKYIQVTLNNLEGLYDKKGKQVVPCNYERIFISEGQVVVTKNKLHGVYDIDRNREKIPCIYDECQFAGEQSKDTWGLNMFYVVKNGKVGRYDINGKEIIPCIYTQIFFIKDQNNYWVMKDGYYENYHTFGGKWGMIDMQGNLLTPIKYANSVWFNSGDYDSVNEGGITDKEIHITGGKYGLLHKSGKEIIPCKYDAVGDVWEDLVAVNIGGKKNAEKQIIGGKWGYIDVNTGNVVIPIEYDDAQAFKDGVARVKKDGQLTLLKNPLKGGNAIVLAQASSGAKKDPNAPAVSRYPAPGSDVDKNIPQSKSTSENLFAFIIANENYPEAPVPFALNDGRIFKEYCLKTLGLPEKQIRMFEDASLGRIIAAVEQIKEIADAYDGDAEVIVYYAGHGVPNDKKNTAYLLPVDGSSSDITTTGYSLEKFYTELSKLNLKTVTVFLDACFSGAKRENEMLASARGVAVKVRDEAPRGNMVVFSAATGDETAHQYEEKGHGLFTYFLLKKLQETRGAVTYGELSDYVNKQVKRQSVVINNKRQTPTVIPSPLLAGKWQNIKLK
jgi:hypothetical protein